MVPADREKTPGHVYGIDFSGAQDAGRKIWVARGAAQEGSVSVDACFQGAKLSTRGSGRDPCLEALREFIAGCNDGAIGLDFPFSLPKELISESSWEEFIESFLEHYADPETFRKACSSASAGKELRRKTDQEGATPFSPYNLRLFRQTFFGISWVLRPLVLEDRARVVPMQKPAPGKPWILEICPASTLKRLGLYTKYRYKGKTEEHDRARKALLAEIKELGPVRFRNVTCEERIVEDRAGDALDSVIAALAVLRALDKPGRFSLSEWNDYSIEGYVFG
jgi:hypothetical protein